jgi:hypothetical protein
VSVVQRVASDEVGGGATGQSAPSVKRQVTPFGAQVTPFGVQRQLTPSGVQRQLTPFWCPTTIYSFRCPTTGYSFRCPTTAYSFGVLETNECRIQAKVLTKGGELREPQVVIPLSVSHSCVDRIAGLFNRHLNSNWGCAFANYMESG